MAGSVNKVTLIGNLGKDPEVRSAQDGTKIVNFTLATSETWTERRPASARSARSDTASWCSTSASPTWPSVT